MTSCVIKQNVETQSEKRIIYLRSDNLVLNFTEGNSLIDTYLKGLTNISFVLFQRIFQMADASSDLTVEEWSRLCKTFRVLLEDHANKRIAIEGQIEEGEGDEKTIKSGVLVLGKTPFEFDEVISLMKNDEQQFKINFINDIYHEYTVAARSTCNGTLLPICNFSFIETAIFLRH